MSEHKSGGISEKVEWVGLSAGRWCLWLRLDISSVSVRIRAKNTKSNQSTCEIYRSNFDPFDYQYFRVRFKAVQFFMSFFFCLDFNFNFLLNLEYLDHFNPSKVRLIWSIFHSISNMIQRNTRWDLRNENK